MKKHKTSDIPPIKKQPLEDADHEFEDDDFEGHGRARTECVCPMCGKVHFTKIRWSGRGVPRKFCQHCRDRETPYEEQD
jgi:hypothetical protein